MRLKFYLPALLLLCFSLSLPAQSLFQDTEDLLQAFEVLKQGEVDSLAFERTKAMAKILAILQTYDQTSSSYTTSVAGWQELLKNYNNNALIQQQLQESNFVLADSLIATISPLAYNFAREIQSGPRQKILNLLQSQQAITPANYLSVANNLQKYSLPPVQTTTTMALAAQESNANINNGILNATAVIQGLFEFILDRAKDEVVINFLDRMLNEDSPDFKMLFPTVISQFSNREFTYSNSFIERLRQAFYEDIQQLSVRLPLLMLEDDYFKPLQSEPVAYGFLALYSMIGMAQNGLTIDEIMPITNRLLYQDYEESIKEVNLELAENAYGQTDYAELIALADTIFQQIKAIYLVLDDAEYNLRDTVRSYQERFPNDTLVAPAANDYLQKGSYDLEVLLGDESGDGFDLSLLPQLLEGRLDSAYIVQYNTLASYDKFFGIERTQIQWRAAGLEIAHNLNGTWYQDRSMADILLAWQKDLALYKGEVDKWKNAVDPEGALQRALAKVENDRQKLVDTIWATKNFWRPNLSHDQGLAFDLLASIIKDFEAIDTDPNLDLLDDDEATLIKLEKKKEKLLAIEDRLIALDNRLKEQNPDNFRATPVQLYLKNKESTIPYAFVIAQINDLADDLDQMDLELDTLEEKYARLESRARNNAKPVLQTTDFATQLMYGLRSDEADPKWMSKVQLDSLLDGGTRQDIFLGLLTQRLSKIEDIGLFSPSGIAQLAQLTITDLQNLPKYIELDTLVQEDTLAFYHRAAFVVNTLNRLLELPLVVSRSNPRTFTPLKDQIPGMSQVPDIANQTLDFIYFVNVKDHRHAVSSLLRLFTYLDDDIDEALPEGKRKSAIYYLQKYGDFIADLIDAESGQQVEDLLNNVADPPGSSRLKRTQQLTVGLNAYLGGAVGWEKWEKPSLASPDDGSVGLAPTMPIGFTISTLLGEQKNSFSLFVSFLDLGSLLSYRSSSDNFGENVISFKNVFKPGVQLQWNIKKTPFYLAIGGQYGPQVREINGENVTLDATRYFMGFGVDVPIKTFYQR